MNAEGRQQDETKAGTGTRRAFRWFWAWNDEREEAWLTDMARQGWHLVAPGVFGFYTFRHGAQANVVYRLDYKPPGKDMDDYVQLFADAGWEHVGQMGGWQYFRKPAKKGEAPEIYTDVTSKMQKYYRVLLTLVVLMPIYIVILTRTSETPHAFMDVVRVLSALLMLLFAYAMVRLFVRILQLRKRL